VAGAIILRSLQKENLKKLKNDEINIIPQTVFYHFFRAFSLFKLSITPHHYLHHTNFSDKNTNSLYPYVCKAVKYVFSFLKIKLLLT